MLPYATVQEPMGIRGREREGEMEMEMQKSRFCCLAVSPFGPSFPKPAGFRVVPCAWRLASLRQSVQ